MGQMKIKINDKINIKNKYKGKVKYIGKIINKNGEWVGFELEEPLGTNNGCYGGIEYFKCRGEKYGIFVNKEKLDKNLELVNRNRLETDNKNTPDSTKKLYSNTSTIETDNIKNVYNSKIESNTLDRLNSTRKMTPTDFYHLKNKYEKLKLYTKLQKKHFTGKINSIEQNNLEKLKMLKNNVDSNLLDVENNLDRLIITIEKVLNKTRFISLENEHLYILSLVEKMVVNIINGKEFKNDLEEYKNLMKENGVVF